jgi:transposase InsO family protein
LATLVNDKIADFDYIECFYNRRRRHTSLGGLSPLTFLNRFFQNQQHR